MTTDLTLYNLLPLPQLIKPHQFYPLYRSLAAVIARKGIIPAIVAIGTCSCTMASNTVEKKTIPNPFEPVYVSDDVIACLMKSAKIRYVKDTSGMDYWQTPSETIERGEGDCEDISIYFAHLLEKKGYKPKVVVGVKGPSSKHGHCWVEFSENGYEYVVEPAAQVIMKRKNLVEGMYVPAYGIDVAIRKYRNYHKRTGKWLDEGFRPDNPG